MKGRRGGGKEGQQRTQEMQMTRGVKSEVRRSDQ